MANDTVVIDANLLVLLVVGTASESYIAKHKRLKGQYSIADFQLLGLLISEFSDVVLLPHILAETSNLARQIEQPARSHIQAALRPLIETCPELPIHSRTGAARDEFDELGLTDAVMLHLCTLDINGICPTLLTVDTNLANAAHSLGYGVIDYKREFQSE